MIKHIKAEPYELDLDRGQPALMVMDMQRNVLGPGGCGGMLGNDVSRLRSTIEPTKKVLEAARKAGLLVIHTREGHAPHLRDLQENKRIRGRGAKTIGDEGPMGRILVRGEKGHDIIPELYPIKGEIIIDKPGKGAFYATDLEHILRQNKIKYLIFCGVTVEVCVNTTMREANDRGFEPLVVEDATGSYFPEFKTSALDMIKAQGGIVGWVADSKAALEVL